MGGTKLEGFLPKNQHTQMKLSNFENWVNGEVSKSAKIWLSKSIFYVKNYPNLSQVFFFHWRIFIYEHIFCYWQITLLSKMMPNLWHLPINPILKIQWFPLSMLIFRQKYEISWPLGVCLFFIMFHYFNARYFYQRRSVPFCAAQSKPK